MKEHQHLKHRIMRRGRRATPHWVDLSYYGHKKRLAPTGANVWLLSPEEAVMMRGIPGTIVVRIEGPAEWPAKKKKPEPEPKKKAKKKAKKK
jgi:hypothetical protein